MVGSPIENPWEMACPPELRTLSDEHRDHLKIGSGISDTIIDARGYYSLTQRNVEDLVALEAVHHFIKSLDADSFLGIPQYRPDGVKHGEIIRIFGGPPKMRSKYVAPHGIRNALDVHPLCWDYLTDPTVPAIIVEGIKKADAVLSAAQKEGRPLLVIAINGCWGWHCKIDGASMAAPDFVDIAWTDRRTYVNPDSDLRTNDDVRKGWMGCAAYLASKTGTSKTSLVVLPPLGTEKQGADDYLVAGNSLDSLLAQAVSPRHAGAAVDHERVPIKLKSGLQLIKESGDRIPHLYDPLIPERSVFLVAGHSGTYKTWHGLSLALDGAFGFPWLDHPNLKMRGEPIRTMYVNKEMSGAILGERLKHMALNNRYSGVKDWEDIVNERIQVPMDSALNLADETQRDRLEDSILLSRSDLVILDSLSMCWHGDENSASEVGALFDQLRGISERTGCTWVPIHHLTKPQGGRPKKEHPQFQVRGSGQLYQQSDSCVFLSHVEADALADGERRLAINHLKARTSQEMKAWIVSFTTNDGMFVGIRYLSTLTEALASGYSNGDSDPISLTKWVYEMLMEQLAMQPTGPGMRSSQLVDLLRVHWDHPVQAAPSPTTFRRQCQQLIDDGKLEVLERSIKHGDLYRLADPEDEVDTDPSTKVD